MIRTRFEADLGFPLDRFQVQALDAVDAGHSVLVAAPTGAGKTVVAEYAVAAALDAGLKAFYTTPIKALSNQKFHDLREAHGTGTVGLLTGDNSVHGEAPVVVMTTEVLRNMIYEGSPTLRGLGVVVLDEVHYLQDPYRGAVWEEIIVHLDPAVRLVCLSATVSNAEEFGDWLTTVRGDTEVVIEDRRPVTLEHLYAVAFREIPDLVVLPTFEERRGELVPNPKGSEFDLPASRPRRGRQPRERGAPRARPVGPRRVEVIEELDRREMLPAIYFIFSRAACDDAVEQCLGAQVSLLPGAHREAVRRIAEAHCEGLSEADLDALGYERWLAGLEAGVAAHHAGMVPPMKEAVEEAFRAGLVKTVFATETLALGVNMPARTVVIERLTKFTGETHEMLTPGQYTQLTGRAGRRGIDDHGFALVLWNRFATFQQVAALASRRTYELTSSFRPTYNMAVNLVRRYGPEEAHHLLNLSFAQYRVDREVVAIEKRADDTVGRLERARERAECERGDVADYQRLVEELALARRAPGGDARARSLTRLGPGDIVHAGRGLGRVVIVQRSSARGGTPRLTAFSESGRTVRLSPTSFRRSPQVLGRIRLPEPFQPKQAAFRKEAVRRLRAARTEEPEPDQPSRPSRADALAGQVADHPVVSCPDLPAHLEALRRIPRLERDSERARGDAERRSETLSRRLDLVLKVLGERGYVDGWALTSRGEVLARIYSEADLLVAECVLGGVFDDLAPAEVAAVASLFTFQTRGPEEPARPRWPTAEVARRAHRVEDAWRDLHEAEVAAGLPETRSPDGGFAETVHAWAVGSELDAVLADDDELTGGDFVRNVKQLVDLLRQLADVAPEPRTKDAVREAAAALFRGVIEASARVAT